MALSPEQTKVLIRLQGVAEELARAADKGRDSFASDWVNHHLNPLIEQIMEILDGADPALTAEFLRTLSVTPRISARRIQARRFHEQPRS